MPQIKRSITAVIKLLGKTVVKGVSHQRVELRELNGIKCNPTKITLTGSYRKRGSKLYAKHGVYTLVSD